MFNSLDPPTRKGLQRTLKGFGEWYAGKERNANVSSKYLSPWVVATTNLDVRRAVVWNLTEIAATRRPDSEAPRMRSAARS